jgi:hypothetical protein
MTEPTSTCPELVSDRDGWGSHRCGRKIKRDGLCGLHAATKERRDAQTAEYHAQVERSEQRQAAAEDRARRLRRHGIGCVPYFQRPIGGGLGNYTGGIVITSGDVVDQLLALLDAASATAAEE